jgi:lysophospholipase L1-like esterase
MTVQLLFVGLALSGLCEAATVLPNDPNVAYTGRFDHTNPVAPTFSWTATQISTSFTGTMISGNFSASKDGARLRIFIDGNSTGFTVVKRKKQEVGLESSNGTDPAGYTCQLNKNYEGENKCYGACPTVNIDSIDACADLCNEQKGCTVIIHNDQSECYLKSNYKTAKDDDPTYKTVSCVQNGQPTPAPAPGPAPSPGEWAMYELAKGLPSGKHTITVWKATEDNIEANSELSETNGEMSFGGFTSDGSFGAPPARPKRRFEFIGDSDTAGWCADGSPSTGDAPDKFEDSYQTWASQLATHFEAEMMVEAVSGWGVGEDLATNAYGAKPIQQILDYTNGGAQSQKWDYSSYTPDAVIILIGPNDENYKVSSTSSNSSLSSTGSNFVSAYLSLLTQVAKNYKNASPPPKIIHVCGGSLNGFDPCEDIQTANNQFNKQATGLQVSEPATTTLNSLHPHPPHHSTSATQGYYTTITKPTWEKINGCKNGMNKCSGKSKFNGCDGHYNHDGHAMVAGEIAPQVKKVLGW